MQLPLHFSSVTKLVVLPSFLHDERRNVYGERERERERERDCMDKEIRESEGISV